MVIRPLKSFDQKLEKLILYAMAALGAFSAWSLFKDQPGVATLQKGALLGCVLVLLCLGRSTRGVSEFLFPFLPFVTITILSAIHWANDWLELKSFITLYIPIIAGVAFLDLRGSVSYSMQQWRKLDLIMVQKVKRQARTIIAFTSTSCFTYTTSRGMNSSTLT